MSKVSMASLALPASPLKEKVNLLTSDKSIGKPAKKPPPSALLCQLAVRMTKAERKRIQKLALELDLTVQDLVIAAIADYREKRGLR